MNVAVLFPWLQWHCCGVVDYNDWEGAVGLPAGQAVPAACCMNPGLSDCTQPGHSTLWYSDVSMGWNGNSFM